MAKNKKEKQRDDYTHDIVNSKITEANPLQILFDDTDKNYRGLNVCTDSCTINISRYATLKTKVSDIDIYRDASNIDDKKLVIDFDINIHEMKKGVCNKKNEKNNPNQCMIFGGEEYYLKQVVIKKSTRFINYSQYPLELNLIHQNVEFKNKFVIICVILTPNSKDLLNGTKENTFFDILFTNNNDGPKIMEAILKEKHGFKQYASNHKIGNMRFTVNELLPDLDNDKNISFETYKFKNKYWTSDTGNENGYTQMLILNKASRISCDFLKFFADKVMGQVENDFKDTDWYNYCVLKDTNAIPKKIKYDETLKKDIQVYQYKGPINSGGDVVEGFDMTGVKNKETVVVVKKKENEGDMGAKSDTKFDDLLGGNAFGKGIVLLLYLILFIVSLPFYIYFLLKNFYNKDIKEIRGFLTVIHVFLIFLNIFILGCIANVYINFVDITYIQNNLYKIFNILVSCFVFFSILSIFAYQQKKIRAYKCIIENRYPDVILIEHEKLGKIVGIVVAVIYIIASILTGVYGSWDIVYYINIAICVLAFFGQIGILYIYYQIHKIKKLHKSQKLNTANQGDESELSEDDQRRNQLVEVAAQAEKAEQKNAEKAEQDARGEQQEEQKENQVEQAEQTVQEEQVEQIKQANTKATKNRQKEINNAQKQEKQREASAHAAKKEHQRQQQHQKKQENTERIQRVAERYKKALLIRAGEDTKQATPANRAFIKRQLKKL
jgi:hypothetical protein